MVHGLTSRLISITDRADIDKFIKHMKGNNTVDLLGKKYALTEVIEKSLNDRKWCYNSKYEWQHKIKTHRKKLPTKLTLDGNMIDLDYMSNNKKILNAEADRIMKLVDTGLKSTYNLRDITHKLSGNKRTVIRATNVEIQVNKSQDRELRKMAKFQRLLYNTMSNVQWKHHKFIKSKKIISVNNLQNMTLLKGKYKKVRVFRDQKKMIKVIKDNIPSAIRDSTASLVSGNYRAILSRFGPNKLFKQPKMRKDDNSDIISLSSQGYRISMAKNAYFRILPRYLSGDKSKNKPNVSYVFHGKDNRDKKVITRLRDEYESEDKAESIRNRPTIKIQRKYNKWFIKYPEEVLTTVNVATNVCAFDPGMRKIFTVVDTDQNAYILGAPVQDKIIPIMNRINTIRLKVRTGKMTKHHGSILEKSSLHKMDDFTDDYYCKLACYLAMNHRAIIAPEIGYFLSHTKYNSFNKLKQRLISHSKFSSRLLESCDKYGSSYLYAREYKTSMTCSICGCEDRKLGSSEVYNCTNCHHSIDRDVNGARNIMIRYRSLN